MEPLSRSGSTASSDDDFTPTNLAGWQELSTELALPNSVARPAEQPPVQCKPHGHAGKVPKYQNVQSWGIPKEDSSSNYRRAEDREAFSNSRIRRLPAPAVPPLPHREHWVRETWEFVVFPDFADLGGGIRRENRRKTFSEEVPQWCALTPSLHPVRHLGARCGIVRAFAFSRFL